ncbi:FecR domain-containing protein [Mucilaginibacter flavus]|uniref:FecR domain-containing protein n=1 Tax=Mucilaginibacter flavus TaxID=931504 RepID=UPI0025B48439|nr:FecR domain-containing protein [Mucilaginibacter flavus]MDN3582956.1 FecR domain-containing protein [Mucilaginibacter flavus]
MNPKEHYQRLLSKYLLNECTPEEAEELFNHLEKDEAGRLLLKNLQAGFNEQIDKPKPINPEISEAVWQKLEANIQQQPVAKVYPFKRWISVAAAAIILITAGLFFFKPKPHSDQLLSRKERYKNDIAPGSNKAILTLANGTVIVLNQAKNGLVTKQGQTIISKVNNGLLSYKALASANSAVQYNTITTPKGGEYQVVLPDGTAVWLNAASSLKFPTAFIGTERDVELTGEAYFEVAKNKAKPFKVTANNVKVEVLGTHFNVNAYNDEPDLKTTLLEGSVKLSSGNELAMLVPGQQGTLGKQGGSFKVATVDTDDAVAWKNGNFNFAKEDVQSILRKVSRWYNVDIVYLDNAPKKQIWGTVSKFDNVSEVLKMIELTGVAHFEIEGRRITVMK